MDMKEKINIIRQSFTEKKGKADDLDELLKQLHAVYDVLKPLIPDEVKAILEKYSHAE